MSKTYDFFPETFARPASFGIDQIGGMPVRMTGGMVANGGQDAHTDR
jgi:hypothetical protein